MEVAAALHHRRRVRDVVAVRFGRNVRYRPEGAAFIRAHLTTDRVKAKRRREADG